jgi:hypothetical protein
MVNHLSKPADLKQNDSIDSRSIATADHLFILAVLTPWLLLRLAFSDSFGFWLTAPDRERLSPGTSATKADHAGRKSAAP